MGKQTMKDHDECFKRLRSLEDDRAKNGAQLDNLIDAFKEFATAFKRHDEEEMKKYDLYDTHITQLNSTIDTLTASIKVDKKEQKRYTKKLAKVAKMSKETDERQKKAIFVGGLLSSLVVVVWVVGTWYFTYVKGSDTIEEMKANQFKNHLRLNELTAKKQKEEG